jgi:hypothetical protein
MFVQMDANPGIVFDVQFTSDATTPGTAKPMIAAACAIR